MALHMDGELQIELTATWGQTMVDQPHRRWLITTVMRPVPVWNPVAPYEINLRVAHPLKLVPQIAFFIGRGELVFAPAGKTKAKHGAYVIPPADIGPLHHRLANVLIFLALKGWSMGAHSRDIETARSSDTPLVYLPTRYPVRGRNPGDVVETYCETISRSWDLEDDE